MRHRAAVWHPEVMTDPSQFGADPQRATPPPPPGGEYDYHAPYPPPGPYGPPGPGPYGPPPGGYAYGYPPAYSDPAAPYGRHPLTGEPLSDKSKLIAGLLQLLGIVGLVGFGRIYLGYPALGVAQLVVGLLTCGLGAVIWGIVDAILILTDKVRDPQGRPLRDGT